MNGVINFLKPPGMSSNGAVVFLKGLLGQKTGHAGTLDPGASGVLPICVGKATRLSSYLMDSKKEYVAEVCFGKRTDTADSYGSVIHISDAPLPEEEAVKEALAGFMGQSTQRTPAYSAAKHKGQKLYALARRGADIPEKHREIQIYSAQYLRQTQADAHLLRIECGKGTYIRTVCEDLGTALGTDAYMSLLVRTKCAGLDIADAYTAEDIKCVKDAYAHIALPAEMFLKRLPRIDAEENCRRLLVNGARVPIDQKEAGLGRVYVGEEMLGIGCVENGLLKISTLLVDV